jgi:hypothetical protein
MTRRWFYDVAGSLALAAIFVAAWYLRWGHL